MSTCAAADDPLIGKLTRQEPTAWFNSEVTTTEVGLAASGLSPGMVGDAAARLTRFAPWLAQAFPETGKSGGIIESPVDDAPQLQRELGITRGRLLLKRDDVLPVSGSVKARGGVHEVLEYAEGLALREGLLPPVGAATTADYRDFATQPFRELTGRHRVVVGSTGNLGLSIGITAAALGLDATVHMSTHAQAWKKGLLRGLGVEVVEHRTDYSAAVDAGRKAAETDPATHFVDDEHSLSLFAGYAVAGRRVAEQFRASNVVVDEDHPLFVYLPCGIGGAPGGVAYGLKLEFGDAVHCIFAEPTAAPCMMLGVYTGRHDHISVGELGLDTRTVADGLAVGRPSGFVGRRVQGLVDGYYTVTDRHMMSLVRSVYAHQRIFVEPSAAAALDGPGWVAGNSEYLSRRSVSLGRLANSTHLAWMTGGGMVPESVRQKYLR